MSYIHAQGHIHRDLKSANVLITSTTRPQAKVADFGSVGRLLTEQRKPRAGSRPSSMTFISDLSLTQGVGTPLYMSLEMLRHAEYDHSTDVWSFGVLLWEIAAQAPPDLLEQQGYRRGPTYSALLGTLEAGHRLEMKPEWPDAWCALMALCWRPLPEDRPSFVEIVQALA